MAEVFDTYMNYGFNAAADIHAAEKPVTIDTYIDPSRSLGKAAIDNLIQVVITCNKSEINDDFAHFKGEVQEPPEYRGRSAELHIQWQAQDSLHSTLTIYDTGEPDPSE